ncbi:hypothetical protein ACA910_020725 [Epithemia clementina (nom. ined.)]
MSSEMEQQKSYPANRRQSSRYQQTLGSLLRHFVDMHLTIELKNGKQYRGILSSAEDTMSLILAEAVELSRNIRSHHSRPKKPNATSDNNDHNHVNTSSSGNNNYLPTLLIRGSTIRYIHFPDHCNLASVVKAGKERERAAANKYQRGIRKVKAVTSP